MLLKLKYFCFLFLYAISFSYGQNPGEFDPTYSTFGGYTFYSAGTTSLNYLGIKILPQDNGDIYSIGSASNFLSIVKYQNDGELDESFGDDGEVRITDGGVFAALDAVQVGDKITILGTSFSAGDDRVLLVRINTDGSLDPSFGNSGIITHDLTNNSDRASDMEILENGKIIVASQSKLNNEYDSVVARFNTDGSLDTSFGDSGVVIASIPPYRAISLEVEIVAGDKILVGGNIDEDLDFRIFVIQYNADGSLDTNFGVDGFIIIDYYPDRGVVFKAMEIRNGNILISGYTNLVSGSAAGDLYLTRYFENGTLDLSFGVDGIVIEGGPDDLWNPGIRSLIYQPNGKFFVGGGIDANLTVWRYNENGTRDTDFADDGIAFLPINKVYIGPNDMRFDSTGKLLLCGTASLAVFPNSVMMTFRVISGLSLGVLDFNLIGDSVVVYPNPIEDTTNLEYDLQEDRRLSLALYDVSGNLIRYLFQNEPRTAGSHTETLEIGDMASGNYLLQLSDATSSYGIKILKK